MSKVLKFPYAGYHEPTSKRIRVYLGPQFTPVADTSSARLVWEHPYYPQYYIPKDGMKVPFMAALEEFELPGVGKAHRCTISVEGKETDGVHIILEGELKHYLRLDFRAMDAWYEEEMQIHVHPKDPYKRIETLPSSRNISVKISGSEVANTGTSPIVCLYETGLPTRYYIPKTSLNWNYIRPSKTVSLCPYKGEAKYYSVLFNGVEYKDIIWYYDYPTTESAMIKDMVCFYNEKVEVWVDGVKEDQPKSKFG